MTILSDSLKANNTYLTSLNLQGNRLKATEATELFQALALNTTLTELSLFDNNISDTGTTELSKALVVNNALAKLDLAQNQIGDTGAAELSKALMVNTVLTMLNLYNKNIGDVGTLALGNQRVKQIFEIRCPTNNRTGGSGGSSPRPPEARNFCNGYLVAHRRVYFRA